MHYPIITKAAGAGGTYWLTEFSITNPQRHSIKVRFRVSQNGSAPTWTLSIPAGATRTWSDFVGDGLGLSGNAAMYLRADETDNPGYDRDCLGFASSVKIYNSGGVGTYGQEIAPANVLSGFMGSWTAYITGIKSYGTAGVSGFRANIGYWHIGFSDENVRFRIFDSNGNQLWNQIITVERHNPAVIPIPVEVSSSGVLVIDGMGEFVDSAFYVSVVDNITGDGVYRMTFIENPDDIALCGTLLAKCEDGGITERVLTEEEAVERLHQLFIEDRHFEPMKLGDTDGP